MRTRKLVVLFAVMALVVLTAISFAQTTKLKRIGLYTFVEVKGQVPTPDVMKTLFERYADDIKTGFEMAGNAELYEPFMDQLKEAEFLDTTMPVGDTLQWMLFKAQDKVKVARNVEWAGKDPLPIFVVKIKKDWKIYDFIIPKGCGNIALGKNVVDIIPLAMCSLAVVPERANVNDPITVDMSGTQFARSMSVEVYDAQGQKLATQGMTPQSPKWQTKFDKPGEYSFRGTAVNMEGIAATNPCAAKVSINFPPICKLWTSCLPCEDYVGRPITFDASGSSDPDGQIAKVVFELLDAQGNVIDTCVTTRKPWIWEKVFAKAGTFTINVTVFDNDGAQSPASDPCRLTFEVTQKKLFWTVAGGPAIYGGSTAFYGFLRAGLFYWITPDKWSFTLSAGGGIPFAGSPWRFVFTAEALANGHFENFFVGTGIGFSTATQPIDANHKSGVDLVGQAGVDVFDKWTSKGSVFFEFRMPLFRTFSSNYKTGFGFRFMF
jgi:hypothetical protein